MEPIETKLKLTKPKKERSPAQKEATAKALSILRAKREAQRKQQEEEVAGVEEDKKEEVLKAKKEQQKGKKIVSALRTVPPEQSPYITTTDFEKFKSEILTTLKPTEKVVEKVVEKPIERIIEKPVEKTIVKEVAVNRVISGNELLDRIFFNR